MNRVIDIKTIQEAKSALQNVQTSSGGIEVMAPKALGLNIKLTKIKLGAANILKQEMLSLGGDAAVAKGVVEGKVEYSDLILLGNASIITKLIRKLNKQSIFGLKSIRLDLERIIDQKLLDKPQTLKVNGHELTLNKMLIMGILNITPDSFSDGDEYLEAETAVVRAEEMVKKGADIIDVGGESTRPGAKKITAEEELNRVLPVIKKLSLNEEMIISVDTYKAGIARKALENGADMINDISALRFDSEMTSVLRDFPQIPVILMHMQGEPGNMQIDPNYNNVIEEILEFFQERIEYCLSAGISQNRILLDPGIGFGKRHQDNLDIIRNLGEFRSLGCPVVIGASRKSFLGRIYKSGVRERLSGSLAAAAAAYQQKIEIIRVHDVQEHKEFLTTLQKIGC